MARFALLRVVFLMAALCLYSTLLVPLIPLAIGQGHGKGGGVSAKVKHACSFIFDFISISSKRERKQGAADSNSSYVTGEPFGGSDYQANRGIKQLFLLFRCASIS